MNRVEIKKRAKEFAFNNKWNIWKPFLVYFVIMFVVGFLLGLLGLDPESTEYSILNLIITYATVPLVIGCVSYVMSLIRGKELDIKEIFSKYKYTGPIIVITFLVGLFTGLWTLLFIIPGIIYALKMSMVQYLMADELDENTNYMDILNKSKKMMDGYKIDFLVFGLSFIGWILLTIVTFGIAAIWTVPYMTTAEIMYYEELKKKNN